MQPRLCRVGFDARLFAAAIPAPASSTRFAIVLPSRVLSEFCIVGVRLNVVVVVFGQVWSGVQLHCSARGQGTDAAGHRIGHRDVPLACRSDADLAAVKRFFVHILPPSMAEALFAPVDARAGARERSPLASPAAVGRESDILAGVPDYVDLYVGVRRTTATAGAAKVCTVVCMVPCRDSWCLACVWWPCARAGNACGMGGES